MEQYLLLLHQCPTSALQLSPEEIQAMIAKYKAWGRGLREGGHFVASNKLEDGTGPIMRVGSRYTTCMRRISIMPSLGVALNRAVALECECSAPERRFLERQLGEVKKPVTDQGRVQWITSGGHRWGQTEFG